MRQVLIFAGVFFFMTLKTYGQSVTLNPTISPTLFDPGTSITVTYDVTGTSLNSLTQAWLWVWIPGNTSLNAKYNINPATATADPAKLTKSVENGRTLFKITFIPTDFFIQDISAQTSLGMLLKANDWQAGQTTDYIANFGFKITLNSPLQNPLFVATNAQVFINAKVPVSADFNLYINDVLEDTQTGIVNYSYFHTATALSGSTEVRLTATSVAGSSEVAFQYLISSESPVVKRPAGIVPGINYDPLNSSRVTLCLWAPGKTKVHTRGDFTNWNLSLMNRDGEYFWIELGGLLAEAEYAFQYLVNESVWVADPYADKILDPDDQYIPSSVYPDLNPFPTEALNNSWYFNRVSVFQTGQVEFDWQVENFEKPAKEKMIVYELLIRDFFESSGNTYASLADTISYFKRLGINAIELMPIMEFGGNNSWGYNPQFMFAPDKAYGPKNKLKEFIDICHQNGIAVILDIAMNHQDMPNPYLMMDFNFSTFLPTAANKWFNISATHPFNVFFDMNHESSYTKSYLDTVNHYWLNEYKVDGFRFDLSKGFTQVNNANDVSAWSAYDASRIAILKRMADKIWEHTPDAFVILEHLSVNSEEKELAEYRAGEGKGMMLWGNMNYAYRQNAMGYSANSDISGSYHKSRSWTVPHLISYMESHDEERMVFSNLNNGASSGSYNTRQLPTALDRAKAAATIFYTIPGPKMLWQFGELGYDFGINTCEDGSIKDECRTYPKPVVWEYQDDMGRQGLYNHVSQLINMRNTYDVFFNGDATISGGSSLKKQLTLKNVPYIETPTATDEMNVVVSVNFDVTEQSTTIVFPHTGAWYEFYTGIQTQVSDVNKTVLLKPGEYRMYTDVPIREIVTGIDEERSSYSVKIYPNPMDEIISIESDNKIEQLAIYSLQGKRMLPERISEITWSTSGLASGLYIAELITHNGTVKIKIVKK